MAFDQNPHFNHIARVFETHAHALEHASTLLGGHGAGRRTVRLVDLVRRSAAPTRKMMQELDALRALLALEKVGDPDSEESACFALIDPTDPAVEEICLLHDVLEDAIAHTHRAQPHALGTMN